VLDQQTRDVFDRRRFAGAADPQIADADDRRASDCRRDGSRAYHWRRHAAAAL